MYQWKDENDMVILSRFIENKLFLAIRSKTWKWQILGSSLERQC